MINSARKWKCHKYSNSLDSFLAAAGSIYLFRVSRDGFSYKRVNKIRGSQPLTHVDWSLDSCYLQTATIDFDLLFWDVKALSAERSPVAMKDVKV